MKHEDIPIITVSTNEGGDTESISSNHPLTTEDPVLDNLELIEEIKDMNAVNPDDKQVPHAIIVDKKDPNKLDNSCLDEQQVHIQPEEKTIEKEDMKAREIERTKEDGDGQPDIVTKALQQQHLKPSLSPKPAGMSLPQHAPATTVTTTTIVTGALDITSPIHSPTDDKNNVDPIQQEDKKHGDGDDDEEDDDMDDELHRITELNRHISVNTTNSLSKGDQNTKTTRRKSLRSQSPTKRRQLLVFADKPNVIKKPDRIIIHNHYGAGPTGTLEEDLRPMRRRRSYMVACDFSDESFHAIEWTMGTIMRDGDRLHVVTVVNREDNPEVVKEAGLSLSKELTKASEIVTEEAKKTLGQMLLFDIELVTHAICGRVKDVLLNVINSISLTMVVCGSRGRGVVKGMLMGSISTFLVHKSPVPVTVIRPQRKKKATLKKPVHVAPLSQSVKSGQLAVDELSKPSISQAASSSSSSAGGV
ncbi:hypothetical protein BDF20DRAFT_842694 [Mycotypha africana]|uniref:uncharacterized protein n=1 Tax=Mycotypha africana TaxID=64632 RepID=UPI0023018050|nr:uncharacterized protein BDF20DRAFT_842694 [Mycotypha africana]KAI8991102.1 hypothetical protein BDF20DRAFT_842694 [Mycotypha africana]